MCDIHYFIDIFIYLSFSSQNLAMIEYCPIFISLSKNSFRSSILRERKCSFLNASSFSRKSIVSHFTPLMTKDSLNSWSMCLPTN